MKTKLARPPSDQAERDRFEREIEKNFCVAAGAGAGKTTAITRRIASLAAARGNDEKLLSKLVIVTYTVLAAEELRARTRRELLRQLSNPRSPLRSASASAHGRQSLLADLRGAYFGTIHSFCLRLVREFGGPLGLPDEVELLPTHAIDAEWESFAASPRGAAIAIDPILARCVPLTDVMDVARRLKPAHIDRALALNPPGAFPALPDVTLLRQVSTNNVTARKILADIAALDRWLQDWQAGLALCALPERTSGTKEFMLAYDALLLPLRDWFERAALRAAAEIADAFRQHRFERRLLTYDDQVNAAARLLNDPPTLRAIRKRGWRVILDEAQDTDGSMFAVLAEITRPLDAPVGTWPDGGGPAPESGRFCFVGDDQQSIYRQRADPRDYRRYVDAFRRKDGGELLTFDVTMRCPQRVIDAANRIFAPTGTPSDGEFRRLAPRPDCPTGGVWRLPLEPPPHPSDSEEQREHEARQVADWLAKVGPRGLGVARWSDVAVIAPRKAWLEVAGRVLRAGGLLPTRELSPRSVRLELPALTWLIALLQVLLEAWDRFELLGVLREIFAVSDVELAELHARRGLRFWPILPPATDAASPRLHGALRLLNELRREITREGITLPEILELVCDRTQLPDRLRAVSFSPGLLDSLCRRGLAAAADGMDLRSWLRNELAGLDQPPEELPSEADAIQLLTCQKAKGLEWPVVICIGFGHAIGEGGRSEPYPQLVESHDLGAQVRLSKMSVSAAEKLQRTMERDAELRRFLYVTMTRSKSLLIVPDSAGFYRDHAARKPNFASLSNWDSAHVPTEFPLPQNMPLLPRGEDSPPPPEPAPRVVAADPARWQEAARISQFIPTGTSPTRHKQPVNADDLPPEEPIPLLVGIGGKDYGSWWHETLQQFPWRGIDARRAEYVVRTVSEIPAIAEWRDRGHEELKRFATSTSCRDIISTGKFFLPEIPFSYAVAGEPPTWIEGILDLLILSADGGAWIVDWKTDRLRERESAEELLARLRATYAPQVDAYASAIEAAGRVVTRRTIYSTVLGSAIDC